MGKYFFYTALLFILSGCFQTSSSFVGPIYTFSSTGNISQTSLNFGLNKIFEIKTGKNSLRYFTDYLKNNNLKKKDDEGQENVLINQNELIILVKTNIEKTKKILSD